MINTMIILAAFAFIVSVAAFPANYPNLSDLSPHLDEGDLEISETQAPAEVRLMALLLAKDAGFSTDVEDSGLVAESDSPRESRSPQHWYKKPQHQGHHDSYQHYQPAHHYRPAHHNTHHGHHY